MRKLLTILLGIFAISNFTGCASIMHGSMQSITIVSEPEGATAKVNGNSIITPATVELKRNKNYIVTIQKKGYGTQHIELHKSLDGWFWGNIIIGGIPGWIVDCATGSASKLSPDTISVTLQKVEDSSTRKEEEIISLEKDSP